MDSSLHERDLDILEAIHNRRHVKQRDLAHILGISVGMTNAIIRRLAQKGLLTIRKVNNRNIRYAVSPDGMEALAKRSVRYLKRTIRNVVDSKQAVEELATAVKRLGYHEIVLVGPSALDFVVEHVCRKYGLEYRRISASQVEVDTAPEETYLLFGENYAEPAERKRDAHGYLQTILSIRAAPPITDEARAEITAMNQGETT